MEPMTQLEKIYERHSSALFAFILNLLRDEELTKEVLQNLFRKLAARPQILDRAHKERPYLMQMAHNQAIDLIRKNRTATRYHDLYGSEHTNLFAPTPDPDLAAFRKALSDSVQQLPEEQRMVVHLKLWERFTFEQIGTTLDISPHTAASRYRYGLDKLRTLLRPLYNEIQ